MVKKHIGFIFLSHIAHIHHAAPVAFELSNDKRFLVTLFVSTQANLKILKSISLLYPLNACKFEFIKTSLFYRLTSIFKNRLYPRIKKVLKNNYKKIISCDALLSPHFNLQYIMDRNKNNTLKFIAIWHGAGDRAFGFSEEKKKFNYLLVPGTGILKRVLNDGLAKPDRVKVVGYPKFDLIKKRNINKKNYFQNDNPIILYPPHYENDLTSWYIWGTKILDSFSNNKNYNLIFAPHIKIFNKNKANIFKKYRNIRNIIIDTNSIALIDMTYTQIADIYLGDVSSQVYEFLYKPRPCIFLNPHNFDWENDKNFLMWHLGDVVSDYDILEQTIKGASNNHQIYIKKQKQLIDEKFSMTDINAGKRAANAIIEFLLK